MFRLLKLIVIPVILAPVGDSQGLSDTAVSSSPKLRVRVGDSAFMGCVVQSTEEKHVVKVDWILSKGEHAVSEYVLYYYSNLSVPTGRFQNRSLLVGNVLRNDGSLLLQNVQEADQGTYTCEIRFESESRVFKKSVELFVLPEKPKELTVHVGDSTEMGCFFQSTKKEHVTKVEWLFSSEEHATEEVVLRYDFNVPRGHSQSQGRFQNRVNLVGDVSNNDGSIMFQTVKLSDQGAYTCRIYLGKLESRKTIVLRVIQKEPRRSQHLGSLSTTPRPETHQQVTLDGNQLVIIVGIVCATLLLLPVLILIVKKTQWNKSSVSSTASLKSLESKEKGNPEKHIYSSVSTWETTEEGPRGQPEATYMTMHPVWPSPSKAPSLALASVRST